MDYKSLPAYLLPYSSEPQHSTLLSVIQTSVPFNAEPPVDALVEFERTPEDLVYARNHSAVKVFDEDDYHVQLSFEGFGETKMSMSDLKKRFRKHQVVAALQCAGNRRSLMASIKPVLGVPWKEAVIANSQWGGLWVRDILHEAANQLGMSFDSVDPDLHVRFASYSTVCEDDMYYGASIPLAHVLDASRDVMLCYELNTEPLSPAHGAPLRLVVPGYLGARWVKWVDTISIGKHEDPNYYMAKDYKILPPEIETKSAAMSQWSKYPAMTSLPLNSVIATTTRMSATRLYVKGYAVSDPFADNRKDVLVERMELSIDAGETWLPARITYQQGKWSWTLWEAELDVSEDPGQVCSRAIDTIGNVQPEIGVWTMRGVAWNGWGKASF